ncbi:MAG: NTP transferase domain-containing protein [Lutibacter sp.]|nr:NTP transferase domain-containing protein [Lutibacter sp.]
MKNNTVFVLLAGGKSERMGVAKGLLRYKQTFWILEQLNRISKTTISEVFIGLGYHFQHYFDAIPWLETALENEVDYQGLKVKVIINPTPELGSFSTLQTVLKNLNTSFNVLLNHIDIPLLNSEELNKIISTKNKIVVPNFEEKNGHPIKLEPPFWNSLLRIDINHKNARLDYQIKQLSISDVSKINVKDSNILKNLNTKHEWLSYLNEINKI